MSPRIPLAALMLSLGASSWGVAAPVASKPQVDPQAKSLLNAMAAAYEHLNAFSCTVQINDGGQKTQAVLRFKRPDLAFVRLDGADGSVQAEAVSDGAHVYQLQGKKYEQDAAPAGGALPAVLSSGGLLAQFVAQPQAILSLLLQSDQTKSVTRAAAGVVGTAPTDTVKLARAAETITFSLDRSDHLIRRLVFARKVADGARAVALPARTETVTALSAAPALVASAFTFTPPAGAEKVDSLQPPMYDPRLKVGADPFPFTAKGLDGSTVSLDDYKGKVVLLDFWATWCGPCRGEMPNVVAAYNKYHAQGFDVLGVSLDQPNAQATLTGFTTQNHMPWKQVYDGGYWQAKVAQQYGVQAIPFSVLIGRDGKIAAVNARGPALAPAVESALAQKATP